MKLESRLLVSIVLGDTVVVHELIPRVRNWKFFLRLALANRLLYFCSSQLLEAFSDLLANDVVSALQLICGRGNDILTKNKDTLAVLTERLNTAGIKFLVIKTLKDFEYVFTDLDILVSEDTLHKSVELISELGVKSVRLGKKQADIILMNGVKIDLHSGFYRYGSVCLDTSFLWENSRYTDYRGVIVPMPSYEAEFLLTLANIVCERYHFSLLDFHYLNTIYKEVGSLTSFEDLARKHGWWQSLQVAYKEFETLNFSTVFPRLLSTKTMLISFLEVFSNRKFSSKKVIRGIFYWIFSSIRFYLNRRCRVPMYGIGWFDVKGLDV